MRVGCLIVLYERVALPFQLYFGARTTGSLPTQQHVEQRPYQLAIAFIRTHGAISS